MKDFFDKLYKGTKKDFFVELQRRLDGGEKTFIVTANPEAFMYGEKDNIVRKLLLDKSTTVVADGIGLVKAAKMLDIDIPERIPGIDIAQQLLQFGNDTKKTIFLFGAKQEVLDALKQEIGKEYPDINILGMCNGYVEDKDKIMQEIISLSPDLILIALGVPNQELLINKYIEKAKKGVFIGVGGTFDVLSGCKKRAPKLFIKLNLEWMYRIICEPTRLKRFIQNNIVFMFKK